MANFYINPNNVVHELPKNNQPKFECKVCGHKENADINASKNIAIPYIDKIIEQTEVQK